MNVYNFKLSQHRLQVHGQGVQHNAIFRKTSDPVLDSDLPRYFAISYSCIMPAFVSVQAQCSVWLSKQSVLHAL